MSSFFDQARFRLDHRWAPEHMSAYLDGELASHSRKRVERHVGRCDECRGALDGLRGLLEALRLLPPPSGGADALQIAAAVRERLSGPPRS